MKLAHWIAGLALATATGAAFAQAKYPVRPVRMVVGFSPGGATDIIARNLAQPLTESLGQSVVVENRPGASSQIAGDLVAKSPPDGHVLMMTTQTLMTSAMIEKKTYPDLVKDFAAVSLTATSPLILAVNPALPVRSVKELIALARARPGELNYASGGIGTTLHLGGELLKNMAKINIVHVPYKGEAPAIIDVIAGHMPISFCNVTACNTFVQTGKMRALAVTGLQRIPVVPGVPTVAEAGLPGFEVVGFFGLIAPAATPREIVTRLNGEIGKALARPDIRKNFASQALEPGNLTAEQFSDYIKSAATKWGKLIKEAGIE
ncbi:MAG TPA: tripartite tricarboxylate transporter substrate binding protein [Burkholderiales bacterium]|nr:tripartite tricarboxylate transporter substrate binding protein [Burkholderiales bacterium]